MTQQNSVGHWESSPAPKDGSTILAIFDGNFHVVKWNNNATAHKSNHYGYPSSSNQTPSPWCWNRGWCASNDDETIIAYKDPDFWARIINP